MSVAQQLDIQSEVRGAMVYCVEACRSVNDYTQSLVQDVEKDQRSGVKNKGPVHP